MEPHGLVVAAASTSTTGWVIGYTIGIIVVLAVADAICSVDSPRSSRSIRSCMFAEKSRISTAVTSLIIPRPY